VAGQLNDIVIDASAALAMVLPTQMTAAARAFIEQSRWERLLAPEVFPWEIVNVLNRLQRRGVLTHRGYNEAIGELVALDIEAVAAGDVEDVYALGRRAADLSIRPFDMAYLALAAGRNAGLASRDDKLLSVARAYVTCFDLQGDTLK